MTNIINKIKDISLPIILGCIFLFSSEAKAQTTFHGKVWRDLYGNPADSADVILYNPHGSDTVMARVSRLSSGYWARAPPSSWNLIIGDTVQLKVRDIDGDSAKTFRDVTGASNLTIDLFTENVYNTHKGHSLLIKAIKDDLIDSVDARCWVKNKPDTLQDRFRRNTSFYNIAFNAENFPSASKPQLGDSVFFKITSGTYEATSKGLYLNQFIDGDTFPSCSLETVGISEEQLKKQFKKEFKISPTISSGNVFNTDYRGKVNIFDAIGRKVGVSMIQDGKLNLAYLSKGIYFVKPENEDFKPEKVEKIQ